MVADKQTSPTKTLLTANTETVSTPGSARKAVDNPGVDLLGPGDFPGPNRSAWMLESVALASIGALPPALDIHAASAAMARLESWRGSPGEFWLRPVSPVSNTDRLSPAIATTALASTAMRLGHHALGWEIVRQAQASATGRPTGLWAMVLFEDRATGVPAMASTAAQSYFAGHRGADVWWGLPADLAGFAIDVPRGILYLNPPADRTGAPPPVLAPTATATPDYSTANQSTTASPPSSAGPMTDPTRPATMSAPSSVNGVVAVDALDSTSSPAVSGLPAGQTLDSTASLTTFTPPVPAGPPLELPLMTPRAWLWLEWDAAASSGTLTVLRVPPSGRSGGAPVLIKTVATGRNPDGTLRGQLDLTEPIDLGPGRVFVLSRRPESSNDEGLGHAADTLHAPGPWISLRRVR
jgi:hypothetical protein